MNEQAKVTQGRWYAKAGVDQLVSEDTTPATVGNPCSNGAQWFLFTDADEHGDPEADANLMAAAKVMRAALETLNRDARPMNWEDDEESAAAWRALDAALVSARGEA